jgi:predicted CopG family antitoxin
MKTISITDEAWNCLNQVKQDLKMEKNKRSSHSEAILKLFEGYENK